MSSATLEGDLPAPAALHLSPDDPRELVLRHVLFFHRHGDRSPLFRDVGSKWKTTPEEIAFWKSRLATPQQLDLLNRVAVVVGADPSIPDGTPVRAQDPPLGELTAVGVDHMRARGRQLLQHYGQFIEASGVAKAPHDHVYALSSNVVRTIQSVQALLVGMFHDSSDAEAMADKASGDGKQSVFYVRTYEQNVLAVTVDIAEIEPVVLDDVAQRPAEDRAAIDALREKLRVAVGIPADKTVPWTAIRDCLRCRAAHGLPLMEGITPDMVEALHEYVTWLWHTVFARRAICVSGFQKGVHEVHQHLKGVVVGGSSGGVGHTAGGQTPSKIAFFSAHDDSIVALISALQLRVDRIIPGYGTIVAFEVYEDVRASAAAATALGTSNEAQPSAFYLRVLIEGTPIAFAGHEHDVLCSFEHFEKLVAQFV